MFTVILIIPVNKSKYSRLF